MMFFCRPAMSAVTKTITATVETGRRDSALAIPNDALLDAAPGSAQAAVLRVREGRVQRVPVQLGLRGLAMTEVLDGLAAGDEVVAAGALAPDQLPEEGDRVVAAGALDPERMPAEGDRVRIVAQAAPEAGDARSGELPVQFD